MKKNASSNQNELNVQSEKEQFIKNNEIKQIYQKLENIENVLNNFDTSYLNHLNKKVAALLEFQKVSKFIIVIIVFLGIVYASIFLMPCSPVYQKTRRQKLLNDILEKHFTELCTEDDATKAVEQCKKILDEWERNQKKTEEEAHE